MTFKALRNFVWLYNPNKVWWLKERKSLKKKHDSYKSRLFNKPVHLDVFRMAYFIGYLFNFQAYYMKYK